MRLSKMHVPTLREAPKDAEVISHQLLLRAGYIRRAAAGIYTFLPLAVRTLEKVKRIIREELENAGAQEILLPMVIPAELWIESGRWQKYGPELLRIKDRKDQDFCIGPTHEEVVIDALRNDLRSYKQLPVNVFQIQDKFRDELRPRAGLMRGREFLMKDGYSFDADTDGARVTYAAMVEAYSAIFTRLGLDFRMVEADTGNIGGSLSHEFQVLADSGEDAIVSCGACDYAANVEKAGLPAVAVAVAAATDVPAWREVATPDARKIEEICALLSCAPEETIKAVCYLADGAPAIAFVRGDRDANDLKVKAALGAELLEIADGEDFAKASGLPIGFVGPVGLQGVRHVIDYEVAGMVRAVCGANLADAHLVDVAPARDLPGMEHHDLRLAVAGDPCPRCADGQLRTFRGIEVGHVFYLGRRYSEAMNATFLDEGGREKPFEMGCYGIGVSRILSAAIEQNHDANGICWPTAIAPFEVVVIAVGKDEVAGDLAESLYAQLRSAGVDAVLDDRDARPGVKFKDADLVGWPLQVVVGRRAAEGIVEWKVRAGGARVEGPTVGLVGRIAAAVAASRGGAPLELDPTS